MLSSILSRPRIRIALATLLMTVAASAAAVPAATAQSGPADAAGVTIQAQEYHFDAPDSISSGLNNFSFQNVGQENHFAQFFKLNPGVSADDVSAALASGGAPATLPLITTAGGGNVIPPGASQQFTLDMTPGSYVLLCFVHDEDDPTPHALKGMLHPFEVTGPPVDATPPDAGLTVTASEFKFDVPTIAAGTQTVQFVNAGTQPHEMTLVKVTDDPATDQGSGATGDNAADVPFHTDSAGGLAAITPGASGWATVNFTPGVWLMLCYVPDAASGAPHATLGMVQSFRVQ